MTYQITPGQVGKIKTMAGKIFGGDDEAYREMLWGVARVKSCKELAGPKIQLVIRHLEQCLGQASQGQGPGVRGQEKPQGPQRATDDQLGLIRGLWARVSRVAQEWGPESRQAHQALNMFLYRRFRAAAPEWLTLPQAQRVIEALKAMGHRGQACGNG